ncbi:MAG TPA: DinB family protein [Candidatus Paceibacterota bacterium]|nr:DinB family protein [Candidatus Paceibacterota bacterium]
MDQPLGQIYLEQLDAEAEPTRKCLERITDDVLDYKPTGKSMSFKSLAITVSEIPKWISSVATGDHIDFATYERYKMNSAADLPKHFDECLAAARKALEKISDEKLMKEFSLRMNGKVLITDTKKNTIDSTIRHLVHHRGQMTVYMREKNIPIPKIYGPSGDDASW